MPERTHYDYSYTWDGCPSVDQFADDPLLTALKREHPELDPGIVRPPRAGDQGIAAGELAL